MTKQNKILLGVGAIVIAGYFVWTNRKKSFANAGGRGIFGKRAMGCTENDPTCNICTESCFGGKCYVPVYDERGNVSYEPHTCSGIRSHQIGGVINAGVINAARAGF